MTLVILVLIASVFSSVLVIAAGMLSSRTNRRERYVESYLETATETPADGWQQQPE
jgi:archaellin